MAKNYWVVKQEPESYAWAAFVKDGKTAWTGVRNFQARNNLRAMKKGDAVFYYHSGDDKQIVGIARVEKEAYADPTADEGDWVAVELAAVKEVTLPITLATVKADKSLADIALARNSRLSVSPLTEAQFNRILSLAKTKL
jgi:predicted RNA-binding protein with PUA-like domain